MSTRLFRIVVKNISAVAKPANRRRFLIVKSEGGVLMSKSAVDEAEERVAERLNRNSVNLTRAAAIHDVFTDDPALYERYRAETTVGRDGQVAEPGPLMHIGTAKSDDSVDAAVARRVDQLLSKTAGVSRERAMDLVFRDDPALAERWLQESYA